MSYAEEVNYWQTSKAGSDSWIDDAKKEIRGAGGRILGDGFVNDAASGHSSFMLAFELAGDSFKMLWPVLQSKTKNERAARVQAATALYHEVKAACVKAKFLGARAAFIPYLTLPGGRTVSEVGSQDLSRLLPALLTDGGAGSGVPQIIDVIDVPSKEG